jgi:hypothetical protein
MESLTLAERKQQYCENIRLALKFLADTQFQHIVASEHNLKIVQASAREITGHAFPFSLFRLTRPSWATGNDGGRPGLALLRRNCWRKRTRRRGRMPPAGCGRGGGAAARWSMAMRASATPWSTHGIGAALFLGCSLVKLSFGCSCGVFFSCHRMKNQRTRINYFPLQFSSLRQRISFHPRAARPPPCNCKQ